MYELSKQLFFPVRRKGLYLPTLVKLVISFAILALPLQADETILTVTGLSDGQEVQDYTLSDIEAMASIDIVTSTPWTLGQTRFTGVPLALFLNGQASGTLRMVALNDFIQNMPLADIEALSPIVAFALDGQRMSVRDKGPLWVVYPFDEDIRFQTETIYARSVWQLRRLHILP